VIDLNQLGERVDSRPSFVAFLEAFRADLSRELARPPEETAWGSGEWSHPDLEGFLETLGAWLTASERFDGLDPTAWKAFAEMLLAARVYE
jgi:hypothetical protein